MDDELSSLESDNGGHHDGHLRDELERIDGEHEDKSVAGLDAVVEEPAKPIRRVKPEDARRLAVSENITIAEAYSRLTGAEEE